MLLPPLILLLPYAKTPRFPQKDRREDIHEQTQIWERAAALAAALTLLFNGPACPLPAAALEGYTNGRMSLVTEPEAESSPYVAYHREGEEAAWSELTWVDGRNGKAVALDGVSQYLQVGDTPQLSSTSLSFASWICWQGARSGRRGSRLCLFPASVYHDQ